MAAFKRSKKASRTEVDELRAQVERLTAHIASLTDSQTTSTRRHDEVVGRLDSLDARITQIGSEVTHQLTELSGDIDSLGRRTDAIDGEMGRLGSLPDVVDEVRTDQVRLASEQARYEIAFRQDLAEIAERVQRSRPSS